MPLTWDTCYTYCEDKPEYQPPSGAIIDTIMAFPNSPDSSSPDFGWFQVGEYHDNAGDKYFMLVNRACSQGEENSAEASSITAIVELNDSVFASSHLLIIDIAHEVDTANGEWYAVPETTYTAMLPDSTIPYTTVLRAGEGRLYKVVEIDEVEWEGNIQTGIRYQGLINAIGDVSVAVSHTLKLVGPAVIAMPETDTISITINGALEVVGYESNEVAFGDPLQHWWDGMILGRCARAELKHCEFYYANTPIETAESCMVDIANSSINEWHYYGIKNYKSFLEVDSCVFGGTGIYGIYSFAGQNHISGCSFEDAPRYAVYISSYNTGYDSTIIAGCDIEKTISPYTDSTQYGIYVNGNNKVRIEGNTIRGSKQGGIYLYNSLAAVRDNQIRNSKSYGIYGYNYDGEINGCDFDSLGEAVYLRSGSNGRVRWSNFDSPNISCGVRAYASSYPDLGDSINRHDSGNNIFRNCASYYIYNENPTTQYIKAEGNYFGGGPPPVGKIRGLVDYTPYQTSPPGGLGKTTTMDVPLTFKLNANCPNPFNPTTNISYSLAEAGYTTITIYNILGQKVTTLVDEYKEPGEHMVIWNGCNANGGQVSSGIYFYRLESGDFADSKKMLVLR